MEQQDIDKNLAMAAEFLAEAKKWGKHVYQPFSPVVLKDIFEAYDAKIAALQQSYETAAAVTSEAHQRALGELHGKVGGLTKKINALENGR